MGLGILRDSLFEEVGLPLQRDHVHEVKGVTGMIMLGVSERDQKTIGYKLDVLAHQDCVHTNQTDRECICEACQRSSTSTNHQGLTCKKLLLNCNSFGDDPKDNVGVCPPA
jgi:hypothetical protein